MAYFCIVVNHCKHKKSNPLADYGKYKQNMNTITFKAEKIEPVIRIDIRRTIMSLKIGQYVEFPWLKAAPDSIRTIKKTVSDSTGRKFVLNQSSLEGVTRVKRVG